MALQDNPILQQICPACGDSLYSDTSDKGRVKHLNEMNCPTQHREYN